MAEQEDSLKFLQAEIHNFKNIECRIIDINGMSLLIMGRNGAGKSSFLQGLMSPMDTKSIPTEPIRKGKKDEEVSSIEITIGGTYKGEDKKYVLTVYFTPGNKKGRLVVSNEKGEAIKQPATFIKSIIGNVSFDPTKWLNESHEKKLKMLKQLTGCEIDIDKINAEIKDKKAVKKSKKERFEELEAVLKNHGYTQEQVDKYSKAIDVIPIQNELTNISKSIENYTGVETQMKAFNDGITKAEASIVTSRSEIERLKILIKAEEDKVELLFADIEKFKNNIKKGDAWFEKTKKPSVDEINKRLADANEHNVHHEKINKHSEQQKELLKAKQEVITLDNDIDELESRRSKLIAKSQLPISGLGFTDDQITIDGLPMESGQINTARLWDIAVDVAIAMKPTLKAIFLHEASLFDKPSLRTIIKKIEDKGYMALCEYVDPNGGELDIKFAETVLA